jgi:hypothetical protein
MQNKIWNNITLAKKQIQRILIISIIVFSLALVIFNGKSTINFNQNEYNENALNVNAFTKDNYTEILTTNKHSLGNITIDDILFNVPFTGLVNENVYHPLVIDDHISGALSINTTSTEFIESTSPALIDFIGSETINRDIATYTFNETLQVKYDNTQARYLIYHSRFVNAKLLKFYVVNDSLITELTEDVDYTIDERDFLVFYYEDYFHVGRTFTFTAYLIWEHILAFGNWQIEQREDQILKINEAEQELTADFNYNFFMIARTYVGLSLVNIIPINFWDVALTVNPLDKELFNDHELMINGIEVDIGDYLTPEKAFQIELSDHFTPEQNTFSLNFTVNYVLRFEEPVGNFWAVDRLVDQRSIRERIYFCNLISGPRHIYLENVVFYESAIYEEEVIDSYSLFDRHVVFTELDINISGYLGLNITIPYLYVGETCPLLIKYITFQRLKIVITDEIKMPLIGARIEVFHSGAIYGTYISNTTSQPIIPRRSDENGQIILDNVPRGNYTIRVFWQGKFVKEAPISTFNEINYIYTSIQHSPLWIIIFGAIIGFILIFGAIFYQKYKKLR